MEMLMKDVQQQTSAKRTVLEAEQVATALQLQSRQTEQLLALSKSLMDQNEELRNLLNKKELDKDLASRPRLQSGKTPMYIPREKLLAATRMPVSDGEQSPASVSTQSPKSNWRSESPSMPSPWRTHQALIRREQGDGRSNHQAPLRFGKLGSDGSDDETSMSFGKLPSDSEKSMSAVSESVDFINATQEKTPMYISCSTTADFGGLTKPETYAGKSVYDFKESDNEEIQSSTLPLKNTKKFKMLSWGKTEARSPSSSKSPISSNGSMSPVSTSPAWNEKSWEKSLAMSTPSKMAGQWSVGAAGHEAGTCKPCAWFNRPEGCSKGNTCEYCHKCDKDAMKRKKAAQRHHKTQEWLRGKSTKGFSSGFTTTSATADVPIWSVGSLGHEDGLCRPCAWAHKPEGCSKGQNCEYCHACDSEAMKRKKVEMKAARIQRKAIEKNERLSANMS